MAAMEKDAAGAADLSPRRGFGMQKPGRARSPDFPTSSGQVAGTGGVPLLSGEFAAVAERLRRSTVRVRGRGPGGGSGVIWRPGGSVITNAHVARGSRATIELSDGRILDAVVTARDPQRDLAALTVEAAGLPAAPVGDSRALRVGQLVLAVGNPLGLIRALTVGIIHAIGPRHAAGSQSWIKADVQLAPGNSGGPLADAWGHVIGINSMIAGGLALAVPSNAVERFLNGSEERPYIGVTLQAVLAPLGDKRVRGLLVLEVASGSPAEKAGLVIGDVLVGAGGQSFNTPRDLASALRNPGPGDVLQVDLTRGGKRMACHVVVRGGPHGAEAA